jgi:5-methylcytosine-specific restriction endonuclease McrA
MCAASLKTLSDEALLRELRSIVARDRAITAVVLAHIAEVDDRRLYAPAGYSSMHAYCVGELKFSDDEAYKRIQVARAGRSVPALLDALAAGRIHLTAARMLAPHVTRENVGELVAAASGRNKPELELWVLHRFGAADRPSLPFQVPGSTPTVDFVESQLASRSSALDSQRVPGPVEFAGKNADFGPDAGDPRSSDACAPSAEAPPEHAVSPWLAPERMTLKIAVDRATYDRWVYARQLLGHSVPSGDFGQVLGRALEALIAQLERRKYAATDRPRSTAKVRSAATRREPRESSERSTGPRVPQGVSARRIPAAVKRAVWRRDEGRCTFVAASGRRCEARHRLEFDHVVPVALGGGSTVAGLRLLCRTHNQLEAEIALGADFMVGKRAEARAGRAGDGRRGAASTRAAPSESPSVSACTAP